MSYSLCKVIKIFNGKGGLDVLRQCVSSFKERAGILPVFSQLKNYKLGIEEGYEFRDDNSLLEIVAVSESIFYLKTSALFQLNEEGGRSGDSINYLSTFVPGHRSHFHSFPIKLRGIIQ